MKSGVKSHYVELELCVFIHKLMLFRFSDSIFKINSSNVRINTRCLYLNRKVVIIQIFRRLCIKTQSKIAHFVKSCKISSTTALTDLNHLLTTACTMRTHMHVSSMIRVLLR